MSDTIIVSDLNEMGVQGANHVADIIERTVKAHNKCMIALSGGNTPKTLYARLASEALASRIPWESTYWFFSDERHVPPDQSSHSS